jgi:hypothetical protein
MKKWLKKKGLTGKIIPGLFDLPELWKVNSTRCNGNFNKIFFPTYLLFICFTFPCAILELIEAVLTPDTEVAKEKGS